MLKPSGSIFVNLGDKYSTGNSGQSALAEHPSHNRGGRELTKARSGRVVGMPPKSLLLLPERYRIACVDELGLIARAVIVWSKPNGLPESVTDRVRRSHEDWVHLTKRPRYFSAVDEIREPHTGNAHPAGKNATVTKWESGNGVRHRTGRTDLDQFNPLGKLPGSVWTVPTEPLIVPPDLGVDHFAAFPSEWPRRLILGWSPNGICCACGEGRRPVAERESVPSRQPSVSRKVNHARNDGNQIVGRPSTLSTITGEACACPDSSAPTRRARVLDPFGGTGTTALVADVLGRDGISVDMSADYCRLAAWRTSDPGERARAMRVPKPDPIHEDQLALFGEEVA